MNKSFSWLSDPQGSQGTYIGTVLNVPDPAHAEYSDWCTSFGVSSLDNIWAENTPVADALPVWNDVVLWWKAREDALFTATPRNYTAWSRAKYLRQTFAGLRNDMVNYGGTIKGADYY